MNYWYQLLRHDFSPGAKDISPETVAPPNRVVKPLTPNVPAIEVSPVKAVTLNLSVLTAKSPVTPNVPPKAAPPSPRNE